MKSAGKENAYRRLVVENQQRHVEVAREVAAGVNGGEWPAIVFVRWIEHGEALAQHIGAVLGVGVPVVSAQTLSKAQREELSERMRRRDPLVRVVVATDVWATGIDIPSLRAVYNCGGGSAAVGLKQRRGRPLRPDGEKTFSFYEVADIVPEGAFAAHNGRRLEVHTRDGVQLSDAALLSQVLASPASARGRRRPAGRATQPTRQSGGSGIGFIFISPSMIGIYILATLFTILPLICS